MRRLLLRSLLAVTAASGQNFEVATIKPAAESLLRSIAPGIRPPCSGGPGSSSPLRLSCQGFTLQQLIEYAYDLRSAQLEAPGWMEEQRFDVLASMSASATAAQVRVMMQNLLAERFHLVVDRQSKVQRMYRLTLDKGGFKRKAIFEPDDEKSRAVEMESRSAYMRVSQNRMAQGDTRPWFRLIVIGDVEKFVRVLSPRLEHPIVDETGLKGTYDFSAEWLANAPESEMIAALDEQLGLKFERVEGPLDMVVVKSADKVPSAN